MLDAYFKGFSEEPRDKHPGWYVLDDDGHFVIGPFDNRNECEAWIAKHPKATRRRPY